MSSIVIPARPSTCRTASIGPTPMISGSSPVTGLATIRARGVTPSSFARCSDMITSAAAPSFSGHELPAVTLPPGLKAGSSSRSFSIVALGHVLGGEAHRDVDVRDRALADELRVQLLRVLRVAVDLGDRLDARGDVDVPLPRLDRVERHPCGLQRRGAEAVHGRAGDALRQPG